MTTLASRAFTPLNLDQFSDFNLANCLGELDLHPPQHRQYVLRMLVWTPYDGLKLPDELSWTLPLIEASMRHQHDYIGVIHPFCYLTVRHGLVTSTTDDDWHVDGFSMKVTHLPEQNYLWADSHATEVLHAATPLPESFDPLRHNIHSTFGRFVTSTNVVQCHPRNVFVIDPYVVHRRPAVPAGTHRTFLRVSHVPIEINDTNNTQNPLLPRHCSRDGVKEFREHLEVCQ